MEYLQTHIIGFITCFRQQWNRPWTQTKRRN